MPGLGKTASDRALPHPYFRAVATGQLEISKNTVERSTVVGRKMGVIGLWKYALLATVVLGAGYVVYDAYRHAVFDVPEDLPKDAWTIAVRSGFRAIVIDVPEDRETRRYTKTPEWYRKTWATCRPFTEGEASYFRENHDRGPGYRWEAVCEIDADGEIFVRGWIASVPR